MRKPLPSDSRLETTQNLLELPLLLIRWNDATSKGGWKSLSRLREESKCVECTSVGFLIVNTEDRLTLVQSIDGVGDVLDSISIPRPCITNIVVLRRGRKRK